MRRLRWLLRNWFRRPEVERALDEELRSSVEILTERRIAEGVEPREARRQALIALGGVDQVKEQVRQSRAGSFAESVWQDVRYAARTLRRAPGFSTLAVFTLALGIGATTAVFSVVNAVLFEALPYPKPGGLVSVFSVQTDRPAASEYISYPTFLDLEEQSRSFEAMAAYVGAGSTLTGRGDSAMLNGAAVTPNLFQLLGAAPLLGRPLRPQDGVEGAPRVVVVSEQLWRGRLAQAADIVGQSLTLDRVPHTVVGVMPRGFNFPHVRPVPQFWMPLTQYQAFQQLLLIRAAPFLTVVGRLGPGQGLDQAQAEMDLTFARLAQQHPAADAGAVPRVVPFKQKLVGDNQIALLALFGAVGLLLLISCTNVAGLQLARAAGRARELATRAALGAGRGRLVRQLLAESLVLALLGGALGLVVAGGGMHALGALIEGDLPEVGDIRIDRLALGFSLLISCLGGVVFGSIPAFASTRLRVQDSLKANGRAAAGSHGHAPVQSGLVIAQVALTLVMLVGAGLLVRTLVRLQQVPHGFNAARVVAATIALPQSDYPQSQQWVAFNDELRDRVVASNTVEAAAYGVGVPFTAPPVNLPFDLEDRRSVEAGARLTADVLPISPGYFDVLEIPVVRGRAFADTDATGGSSRVTIVNQSFARRFFGTDNPVGQYILMGQPAVRRIEIVGVVGDTLQSSLTAPAPALVYMPFARSPFWITTLIARTRGGAEGVLDTIRRELSAIAPGVPMLDAGTLDMFVGRSFAASERRALLLGTVSGLALVLATVSVYGILTYMVTGRTHEIGVRLALGADPRRVLWLVLGRGLALVATGIVAGLALSVAATRILTNLLFGVSALDPTTLAAVVMMMMLVTILACWFPARRATNVDPLVALRTE